ncbi:unnamed protein product, partial [Brassica oleracea]
TFLQENDCGFYTCGPFPLCIWDEKEKEATLKRTSFGFMTKNWAHYFPSSPRRHPS